MDNLKDFKFEDYEKYFGDVTRVKKTIENCPKCDSELVFSHNSNKCHLITQETATCGHCSYGQRKLIYQLN